MQEQDPEVSGSDGSQSFNKALLFQFHDFTADDPRKSDPGIDHDRDQHALHALSKKSGHLKAFRKIIRNLALIIAALTVLAVGGAWLLGIPVISLLYPNLREGLSTCRAALVLIILGKIIRTLKL